MKPGLFCPPLPGMVMLVKQIERALDGKFSVEGSQALTFTPGGIAEPPRIGQVTFELTNDTTLTVKACGSDGIVRSATLTLA